MRLIDADLLIQENANIIDCDIIHPKYEDTLREIIERAPTVTNVRENVSARWIGVDSDSERYDEIRCSNCRRIYTVDADRWCDIGFIKDDLKYCPNCGAKAEVGDEVD